jgi:tetratricopeptide (TPR) repeat protein
LYSKADAITYTGRYDEAITVYDNILSLNPDAPNALGRKGLSLYDWVGWKKLLVILIKF